MLISQLADHRTRAAARRELRDVGSAAAEQLLVVLQDRESPANMRWAGITLLAHCKHGPAVPVLIEVLASDPNLQGEAVRALQTITGHDLGEDVGAWKCATGHGGDPGGGAVAETEEEPVAEEAGEKSVAESRLGLVRAAVGDVASELSWEEPGYVYARIELEAGRKQQMIVTFDDSMADPDLSIYTECGPPDAEAVQNMSRRNVTVAYGAFGVETEDNGSEKIVMRHGVPLSRIDVSSLREILLSMAREADNFEYELTQNDRI